MKSFCTKFFAAFLFLVGAFNAKAVNDTLTIGQAFDWKVGDTLVYKPFSWCNNSAIYYSPATIGFVVKSKTSFADSILYAVQYFDSVNLNMMLFTRLDSLASTNFRYVEGWYINNCNGFDSLHPCPVISQCSEQIYSDSTFHNFLTINRLLDFGEIRYSFIASEQVGLRRIEISALEYCNMFTPVTPGGCGSSLVYYHSDSIIWMDTTLYSYTDIHQETFDTKNSFRLYPNPASDELTITAEGENSSPFDLNIYDIMGNCVLAHKNISHNMENIKVISLPPGYYLLKLTDGHSNTACKGFIVAR